MDSFGVPLEREGSCLRRELLTHTQQCPIECPICSLAANPCKCSLSVKMVLRKIAKWEDTGYDHHCTVVIVTWCPPCLLVFR